MGATVRKISVSLDPDTHAWATERAKREGTSLSAVIDAALRMEQHNEAALRVVTRIGVQASAEEVDALVSEWSKGTPRATRAKPKTVKSTTAKAERSWRSKSA